MHLKRRIGPVSDAVGHRTGATLKPLSAPTSNVVPLDGRSGPSTLNEPERQPLSSFSAVLQHMAEQVRQLAATLDSLRREVK